MGWGFGAGWRIRRGLEDSAWAGACINPARCARAGGGGLSICRRQTGTGGCWSDNLGRTGRSPQANAAETVETGDSDGLLRCEQIGRVR